MIAALLFAVQVICFDVVGTQQVYKIGMRQDDGADQCCGAVSGFACSVANACTLLEPGCCPDTACCGIPIYADCRVSACFCKEPTGITVSEAAPCIETAEILPPDPNPQHELFMTRVGWLVWLVLGDATGAERICSPGVNP